MRASFHERLEPSSSKRSRTSLMMQIYREAWAFLEHTLEESLAFLVMRVNLVFFSFSLLLSARALAKPSTAALLKVLGHSRRRYELQDLLILKEGRHTPMSSAIAL